MTDSRPWTPEDDARLLELKALGWTREQIAEDLGRSLGGIADRQTRLRKAGKLAQFVPQTWTEEEIAWLKTRYGRRGWNVARCAEHLGKSESSVKGAARRYGIVEKRGSRGSGKADAPPPPPPGKRRCHDCGRPTVDYRYPRCWARLRAAGHYDFDDEA